MINESVEDLVFVIDLHLKVDFGVAHGGLEYFLK